MAIAEPAPGAPFDVTEEVDDSGVLDAYSAAVSAVAEALIPSVASLRVTRQGNGWSAAGSGSAVAFTPDGYLVTSAHVVAGVDRGQRHLRRRNGAAVPGHRPRPALGPRRRPRRR